MSTSNLYGAIPAEFPLSPPMLNARVNYVGTGAEINALSPTYAGMEAHCTADYLGIFRKNHVYIRDADNQKWISITGFKHLHDDDTEESGGLLSDIMVANGYQAYIFSCPNPTMGAFVLGTAGLGKVQEYWEGLALELSSTQGDAAIAVVRGVPLSCSRDFTWLMRMSVDSGSYMSIKAGVGMEDVASNDDILNKVGIEACDVSGTARTFAFTTANGSARDMIGTSIPVSVANTYVGYTCYLDAGNVARFVYEGAHTIPALSKTTNLPSSGATQNDNVWTVGYKNNNNSAKSLFIGGAFIYGSIGVPM